MDRTPESLALELYARGFTNTRVEAHELVAHNPHGARILLGLPPGQREMRHGEDRAHPDEWGHAG